MDRISELPDELLLTILSMVPTKVVVVTMVLSKRWKFLWKLVPRLVYEYNTFQDGNVFTELRFLRFFYNSLLLNEAPVLKALRFNLGQDSADRNIGLLVKTAGTRCVRNLAIEIDSPTLVSLPLSLYGQMCRMLTILNLSNMILEDTSSLPASFPTLIALRLVSMTFPSADFLSKLLSCCPILEFLEMRQCLSENELFTTIRVPSLKYLSLHAPETRLCNDALGFVIDCPSLLEFDFVDQTGEFCVIENGLPHIVKADIDCTYRHPGNLVPSVTSAKRLSLCLTTSKDAYPVGTTFSNLVHFEIGTCETEWLNLLMRVLNDSPRLRSLKLDDECHDQPFQKLHPRWEEPNSVPKCLLVSLETLEWVGYEGSIEKEGLLAFILRSGSCLKKVTISPAESTIICKRLQLCDEVSSLPRRSPKCAIVMD